MYLLFYCRVYDPHFMFKGMTDQQRDINTINIIDWCMKILKSNVDDVSF
jgi:hypothetical protein